MNDYVLTHKAEECQCLQCDEMMVVGQKIFVSGLGNWYCNEDCYLGKTSRVLKKNKLLSFVYKNWKGEIGNRTVYPIKIYYGSNEYHTEDQWLMEAFDIDKNDIRIFAMTDIINFIKKQKD